VGWARDDDARYEERRDTPFSKKKVDLEVKHASRLSE